MKFRALKRNVDRDRGIGGRRSAGSEALLAGDAGRVVPALLVQALITAAVLFATLRLWRTELHVPFEYWGDTLLQLAIAKNIADGGSMWFIDRLGAPFGLAISAFPQNLTTSSIVLQALSVFSRDPSTLLNAYWMLTVVAASVNAHLALRVLGSRIPSALAFATLYALLPYAFGRNVAHLPLVYPFVPVLAAFAVQVASGISAPMTSRWGRYVTICAVAQGFDYVYYSFFASFVLIVAAMLAVCHHRSPVQARRALLVVAILTCSTIANLAPTFVEWARHGKPPNTGYKTPQEAEIYGLKLRQLLSPVQPSRFEALRKLGEEEARFPNENENAKSRLGTVLAIGLLAMIFRGIFRANLAPGPRAASALALACFMLATVGGFGALFNLLVVPDIRAYNRIVVFIAFFVVVFMADVLDSWSARHGGAGAPVFVHRMRPQWVLPGLVLLVGVLDQGQAARPLVSRYATDRASLDAERLLVGRIERLHPNGGAIMQLPETTFPPDGGRLRMATYDHARAYLSSTKLSWSWPSFSKRREAWYRALGNPAQAAFADRLVAAGFVGIWLDRYGYDPSELATLENALSGRFGPPLVGGIGQRYAYFDLVPPSAQSAPSRASGSR